MDVLQNIESSRASALEDKAPSTICRRDSSISLEDKSPTSRDRLSLDTTHPRTGSNSSSYNYDPAKSPLLLFQPHELHTPNKLRSVSPDDCGCPLLPEEPSPPSTPSITRPLEVYLYTEEKHELFLMKNASAETHNGKLIQGGCTVPGERSSSVRTSETSSWQFVDEPSPSIVSYKRVDHKATLRPVVVDDEVVTLNLGDSQLSSNFGSSSGVPHSTGIRPSQSLSFNFSNPSLAPVDIVPAKRYCVSEDQNSGDEFEEFECLKRKVRMVSGISKKQGRLSRAIMVRKHVRKDGA